MRMLLNRDVSNKDGKLNFIMVKKEQRKQSSGSETWCSLLPLEQQGHCRC